MSTTDSKYCRKANSNPYSSDAIKCLERVTKTTEAENEGKALLMRNLKHAYKCSKNKTKQNEFQTSERYNYEKEKNVSMNTNVALLRS